MCLCVCVCVCAIAQYPYQCTEIATNVRFHPTAQGEQLLYPLPLRCPLRSALVLFVLSLIAGAEPQGRWWLLPTVPYCPPCSRGKQTNKQTNGHALIILLKIWSANCANLNNAAESE